ncbi:hypothetical protein N8I77_010035 [Diaporthe amygdali]|uniref:Chitinase n=1 Tax=Phomopsis amygdali TaxID=1214568 RepID=A0AAD9W1E3_PHOAM|nr:hypothetical protein N8I77_010035 [Diaporthe amygdali]
MHFHESLAVAALAAVPVLATSSSVNVYWGQQGNGDLATACQDPSIDYITLGFVNLSPENGGATGYPGNNFGAHCWAEKYSVDGQTSELLTTCPSLTPGIAVCQGLGKKVLLSIGGVYSAYSNYTVSTEENGVAFAEFIFGAFGPYTEDWAGKPRPFDNGDNHNVVDGYDFDLESSSAGDLGYAAMITTLRALITVSGRADIITAAPQCPLNEYQNMKYLLDNVQFDRLWIQFYNNPDCSLLLADGTPNPGFNYAAWEQYLASTPSSNAKLHIGLPGSADAAGSGYVDASVASTYLCEYGDYSMFGGVMIWDQWFAAQNTINGASYNQVLYESMKCGCKACPAPTSTISTVISTSAASTSSSTLPPVTLTSSTTTSPVATPTCTGFAGYDKDGTNIGFYADAASATYSGCLALCDANENCLSFGVLSTPACALYSYSVEGNDVADANSGNTFYNKGGVCPQPSSSSSVVTSATATTLLSSSSTYVESSTASTSSEASSSQTSETSTYSATTLTTSSGETASTSDASSSTEVSETSTYSATTLTSSAETVSTSDATTLTTSSAETASTSNASSSTQASETSTYSATTLTTSSAETASTSEALSTEVPPLTSETDSVSVSSTTTWGNTTWTTKTTSSEAQTTPTTIISSSSSVHLSTRPPTSWTNSTWTSNGPSSTIETVNSSTVDSSTVDSSTKDSSTVVPTTSTSVAPEPTTTGGNGQTTQTFYSTTVLTVTSCAPTVTDCPGKPHVTTSLIPVSSTVVSVGPTGDDETVTATVVPVTSTSSAAPVTDGEQLTTSTVYSTTIYTVTSCPPAITDCPGKLGSVTTQIIAISTTVCPVTEGGHAAPTPPAQNGGSGSTPSETKPAGSGSSPSSPAENEGGSPSPSAPAETEGSHPSPPEATEEGTSTSTIKTKLYSTITLPVVSIPTAGSEGSAPPPVNNAGSGPSSGFSNSTATKTFSLATIKPTGAGVPVPQSTQTSVVTAGAARSAAGIGMTVVMGVMVFFL